MPRIAGSRHAVALALCAALTVIAGCGGGGSGNGAAAGCTEPLRKQFVLDVTRQWYLFPDLLPSTVDATEFATAEALLDRLTATAREQRKDRFFSYLTTRSAENSLFGAGQYVGFGLRTRTDPGLRPFVSEVFESSPAEQAGVRRGDEILAVDSGDGFVPVSELLADGSTITEVLGPELADVRRSLRLLRDAATLEVALVKRTVTIDPVSDIYGAQVLPLAGTTGVGYLNLRTYVATADAQLREAFGRFRALGIEYFIVDLRYNGGGLLATAELLGDLLGGERRSSDVQLRTIHSPARSAQNSTRNFRPGAQSVRPVRIAFLTTGESASASEINVNTQAPWVEVAIVGEDTFGKPVGQQAFDLRGCDDRLRLVTFKTENALGESDYYDGLASQLTFACAATDALDEPLGSVTDGLTAAAMHWLRTGACASVIPPVAALGESPGTARFEAASTRPASFVQLWMPGAN